MDTHSISRIGWTPTAFLRKPASNSATCRRWLGVRRFPPLQRPAQDLVGYARKTLICLDDTPYYHVIARCVRRAWLWGFDEYAGRDYSHRKAWVRERLECKVWRLKPNLRAHPSTALPS